MIPKPLLLYSLPLMALSAAIAWRVQAAIPAPGIALKVPALTCSQPPAFRTVYRREDNGVSPVGPGFNFQGVSWVEADLCAAGALRITAEGKAAAGQAPVLDVALNSQTLASEAFEQRRTVTLRVPHAGRLTLGYFNDYYLSDARVAVLENFKLSGAGCNDFKVQVPRATGGQWTPETGTASLVYAEPMTVTPCSGGIFSAELTGRAGNKIFPSLIFQQRGKRLLSAQTGPHRRAVQMNISSGPVTISLVNPYFKELADRNLNVIAVQFVADKASQP